MDQIDRIISEALQYDSRKSTAEIAKRAGVSLSTAHERIKKLSTGGNISAWRVVLDASSYGVGLCGFILLDVAYKDESETTRAIAAMPEVQELHHISGPHSYLMKVRVRDTRHMQDFLQNNLKPLTGLKHTETVFVLDTVKETSEIQIVDPGSDKFQSSQA